MDFFEGVEWMGFLLGEKCGGNFEILIESHNSIVVLGCSPLHKPTKNVSVGMSVRGGGRGGGEQQKQTCRLNLGRF